MTDSGLRIHKKKGPACDSCKAKRVLCHPQPPGIPCPRCAEKGYLCTTTPVVRRKPRRRSPGEIETAAPSPSASSESEPSGGSRAAETSSNLSPMGHSPLDPDDLPTSLVSQLIRDFMTLPQAYHPGFSRTTVFNDLGAVSYHVARLSSVSRTVVYSILATAALATSHPLVLGFNGPHFPQISFDIGQDLREYGSRRQAFASILHRKALDLALSTSVLYDVSWDNIVTCYLLDFVETCASGSDPLKVPRSFASAHASHIRNMASREGWDGRKDLGFWSFHIMTELLYSIRHSRPIIFTLQDHNLICGDVKIPSMVELFQYLSNPTALTTETSVFRAAHDVISHLIRIAWDMSDRVTGVPARRGPFDEVAFTYLMNELNSLQPVLDALAKFSNTMSPTSPPDHSSGQGWTTIVIMAWTTIVYAAYSEVRRRWDVVIAMHHDPGAEHMRMILDIPLRQSIRLMALAGIKAADRFRSFPCLVVATNMEWARLDGLACALIEEDGTVSGELGLGLDAGLALISIRDVLKLRGWSHCDDLGPAAGIIDRIEQYLSTSNTLGPSAPLGIELPSLPAMTMNLNMWDETFS